MSPYHAWPFLSDPAHPFLSAVWAVLVHGVIALIVVAPILWRSRHRVAYAALAIAGGSLLDIDHFVAAGSINLHTIETLGSRPATHSLGFIALIAVAALLLTRRAPLAWSLFAVNAAHVMFDAAGGHEQPLYPLRWPGRTAVAALPGRRRGADARQRVDRAAAGPDRRAARSASGCDPASGWADARPPAAGCDD